VIHNSFQKTASLTILALVAFAANSVLCRLALDNEAIDAASFTAIRLLSGIIVLFIIIGGAQRIKQPETLNKKESSAKGSWFGSVLLFVYAVTFSYAYISLDTGTGALILFGAVQITMIMLSLISGTRLHSSEWVGVIIAFIGFVYLILPKITTPSVTGFVLMTISGVAWGIYTLQGRNSKSPLTDTAYNFLRTTPLIALLTIASLNTMSYTTEGIVLAILSGGIASGIGYTIWYLALEGLSSSQAAVIQLSVPAIAALGGVIFVSEAITLRFAISSTMILGGILLVVLGKYHFAKKN
jgi:drug/metabolite transporter (DMT)-like permease